MNKPVVTKAVIAAAGLGTRFLPQTKAMPKEMLPLIDKPIIQYVVEELVGAGIRDIIIITGANKRSLEDHFDTAPADLVTTLEAAGAKKALLLHEMQKISDLANFIYIRQKGPYGNATPLMNAAHLLDNGEPFIYTFADDFITATPTRFQQMIQFHQEFNANVLSCIKVRSDSEYDSYGIVAGTDVRDGVIKMDRIIEKPGKVNAPSDLASVSAYLLSPKIFPFMEAQRDALEDGKELNIQPAMQAMIEAGNDFYGCEIKGGVFNDSGNKLEYLKTVVDFALKRDDLSVPFYEHLQKIVHERESDRISRS